MKTRPLPKGQPSRSPFPVGFAVLAALALTTTVALDYLASRKKEPSFLFPPAAERKEPRPPEKTLEESVRESLSRAGIPGETVERSRDSKGELLYRVRIEEALFDRLARDLEKFLREAKTPVKDKSRKEEGQTIQTRWEVRKTRKDKLSLIFAWERPKPEIKAAPPKAEAAKPEQARTEPTKTAPSKPAPAKPAVAPPKGKVALVVDDMGNSLDALDELVALGRPLDVSILPYSLYARETAERARGLKLEVLLHLPLESINGGEAGAAAEGIVQEGMSEDEIRSVVEEDLRRVPLARGVNNHTGSKATADETMMERILSPLRGRGLFFLDSRTSGRSVAYDVAQRMGIPAAFRHVFLDADGDRGRIKDRLLELFRLAQKNGRAVGICHPFPETLQVLRENFRLLEAFNLEAVFVSELVR